MRKQWDVVEILRHSRHDWLNKIQLIKGNLALNKLERVKEIIEEIVREAQQEGKLTYLKANGFAELLMTYNWEARRFTLEYEVLGDVCDLSACDEALTDWCEKFLRILEEQAATNESNHLSISIETEDGKVKIFFDYTGRLADTNTLTKWLSRHSNELVTVESFNVNHDEMTVFLTVQT